MSVSAITAALSIAQGVSGFLGGIMDKEYALEDAVSQYDLALRNLGMDEDVVQQNLRRSQAASRSLGRIQSDQLTQFREGYQEQVGRNVARVGAGAVTAAGSTLAVLKDNAMKFRRDERAFRSNQAQEQQALRDEASAYQRDLAGIRSQRGYLNTARRKASQALGNNVTFQEGFDDFMGRGETTFAEDAANWDAAGQPQSSGGVIGSWRDYFARRRAAR
jgi:hypothetical protein